jgi:hypothetical protein
MQSVTWEDTRKPASVDVLCLGVWLFQNGTAQDITIWDIIKIHSFPLKHSGYYMYHDRQHSTLGEGDVAVTL